jgi:VWFA-related protein
MRVPASRVCVAVIIAFVLTLSAMAQSGRGKQTGGEGKKNTAPQPDAVQSGDKQTSNDSPTTEAPVSAEEQQGTDVVRVETNLVTVPVIASTRGGMYVPDLKKEEFTVFEDGVQQELAFFATVTEPFHLVLMLDTSGSTQEKLSKIQQAAIAFTEQLQTTDRVKVISFDDSVRDLSDFSSDRAVLQWAIRGTRPGKGTRLYDAMGVALKALERVKGRKAIVIFTDGVDWHSERVKYEDNFRMIEESGVIIYPIRYDTREETERLVRQQQQSGQVVDLGGILGGGTPTTFPGGSIPTGGGTINQPGTLKLPGPITVSRGPGSGPTTDRRGPDASSRYPDPRNDPNSTARDRENQNIMVMLDQAYLWADSYLNDLATKSGGRLLRADTLGSLPEAFAQIAAELRTQYSLGYYPTKTARDGKFRKVQVRTTRKGIAVRSRPGYRAKQG